MHHGYFMTGDLGYVDKEGFFHYVDRKKDLIIKGGINISLAKLMKHPTHLLLKKQLLLEKRSLLWRNHKVFHSPQRNCSVEKKNCCHSAKQSWELLNPSEIEFVNLCPKVPLEKFEKRTSWEK